MKNTTDSLYRSIPTFNNAITRMLAMSKRTRLHFKHAKYHIMLRGNYKQTIFADNSDYLKFYDLMEDISRKYQCKIQLFCLMTNHIHMVIEVDDIPLSKIMQCLVSRYAKYFNKKLKRIGHLFQDRYLAKPIMNDNYLQALCYYIHNNPRAAKIVDDLAHYPWSSHRHYCRLETIPWLASDPIIKFLQDQFHSRDAYYNNLLTEHENSDIKNAFCDFDEDNNLIIATKADVTDVVLKPLDLSSFKIPDIGSHICNYLDVPYSSVCEINLHRKVIVARAMIAYFSHYHAGYYLKEIATVFKQKPDSVSINLHKMVKEDQFRKLRNEVYSHLERLTHE